MPPEAKLRHTLQQSLLHQIAVLVLIDQDFLKTIGKLIRCLGIPDLPVFFF